MVRDGADETDDPGRAVEPEIPRRSDFLALTGVRAPSFRYPLPDLIGRYISVPAQRSREPAGMNSINLTCSAVSLVSRENSSISSSLIPRMGITLIFTGKRPGPFQPGNPVKRVMQVPALRDPPVPPG